MQFVAQYVWLPVVALVHYVVLNQEKEEEG